MPRMTARIFPPVPNRPYKKMDPKDNLRFAEAKFRALVGVNRGTWSRWITGKSRVPVAVTNLLRVLVAGEILHDGWNGWTLRDGKLFDPSGQWHTPSSITAWEWTRQILQTARAEENKAEQSGENIFVFTGRRSARAVTAELYRRLDSAAE